MGYYSTSPFAVITDLIVMAWLVLACPGHPVLPHGQSKDVDARDKRGHDVEK
jgi:hypothetical protein